MTSLVNSYFMIESPKSRLEKALEDVIRLKKFYQKGYDEKRWEERKPESINKLISAERNIKNAILDLEEMCYQGK